MLIFYLAILLISPLIQDGVWGVVEWNNIVVSVIKSLISVVIIFITNIVLDNIRAKDTLVV